MRETVHVGLRVPANLRDQMKAAAASAGLSANDLWRRSAERELLRRRTLSRLVAWLRGRLGW